MKAAANIVHMEFTLQIALLDNQQGFILAPQTHPEMKFNRKASATWQGTGLEGSGTVSTQSKVLDGASLTFKTRFEGQPGANPEELVAAALAGCFSMKLSFVIVEKGFAAEKIDTNAIATFADGAITKIHLEVYATVPGMSEEQFDEAAAQAKAECPISKSLKSEVTMESRLL